MNLGMEPARGVDQQHVDASAFCRLHAVEDHRGGIGTGSVFDDFHAGPLAPGFELFDGGSAKRIAGHQQNFFARLRYCAASLPIVVVLPTPLTPRKSTTQGRTDRGCVAVLPLGLQHLDHRRLQSRGHLSARVLVAAG